MLCSRAITREEAAMSGSIAAFVFVGSLCGELLLDPGAIRQVGTLTQALPNGEERTLPVMTPLPHR